MLAWTQHKVDGLTYMFRQNLYYMWQRTDILLVSIYLYDINGLVWMRARILALEENLSRMKDWMKSICKKILGMGVTFRDESNDSN